MGVLSLEGASLGVYRGGFLIKVQSPCCLVPRKGQAAWALQAGGERVGPYRISSAAPQGGKIVHPVSGPRYGPTSSCLRVLPRILSYVPGWDLVKAPLVFNRPRRMREPLPRPGGGGKLGRMAWPARPDRPRYRIAGQHQECFRLRQGAAGKRCDNFRPRLGKYMQLHERASFLVFGGNSGPARRNRRRP